MMKSVARSVSLAALALFATVSVRAEVMKHEAAGIQFDLPEGWTHAAEGEGAIRVKNADETVEAILKVADKSTVEDAAKDVAGEVDAYLTDVKLDGEPAEETHNDLKAWSFSGTGKYEGEDWAWKVSILAADKPVVVLFWATPDVLKELPADFVAFYNSIKKAS